MACCCCTYWAGLRPDWASPDWARLLTPTCDEPSPYWSPSTSELLAPWLPAATACERPVRRHPEAGAEPGQLQTLMDSSNSSPVCCYFIGMIILNGSTEHRLVEWSSMVHFCSDCTQNGCNCQKMDITYRLDNRRCTLGSAPSDRCRRSGQTLNNHLGPRRSPRWCIGIEHWPPVGSRWPLG